MFFVEKPVVIPRINFLISPNDEKKNKCLKRLNFLFITLHVFLSLDFGFAKYKSLKQKLAIKVLTMLQCICITLTCITCFFIHMDSSHAIWYSVFCLEYASYVLVLIFSKTEKSFYHLQNDLNSLDNVIGVNSSSYNHDIYMIVSCLIIIIFRTGLACIYCAVSPDVCVAIPYIRIVYFIPLFCVDIVLVIYFFTFYSIYCRLKKFTDFIKDSSNIIYCHFIYKTIVDFTEKVKDTFDAVFLVSLLFNTPELMACVFFTLVQFTSDPKKAMSSSLGGYFTTTQSLIVIFSPAFSAGLLAAQVQKIKLVLHDKLLMERDRKHAKDIKRFIGYIEARPLRFTVCKVIPLDWNLPIIVVNLCITYLIVIIQFTHLY